MPITAAQKPAQARRNLPLVISLARQKGVVLFIALIVLVAMTLAGIALVRAVDTSNIIAGNLAFKQGATQAADIGVEVAFYAMPTILSSLDTVVTGSTGTYWYYPTRREHDAKLVPTSKEFGASGAATAIPWNSVPVATTVAGNEVRVVIDRLCQGPAPVINLAQNCFLTPGIGGGSQKIGSPVFSSADTVFYRVTARISGPRNSISIVQAILER